MREPVPAGSTESTLTAQSVGDAMRQVLAAETAAAQQLTQCQTECQAALEAARLEARNTMARAETIAQAIHGRIERIAAERAENRRRPPDDGTGDANDAELAAAIRRLAARLIGCSP